MKKVNFGVIGLGRIANDFCNDLVKSDNARLCAVASRSEAKSKDFANKYGAEKAYDSYKLLVEDEDIDIVYIATPHVFHKDISIMCMERGKSVLCEKPAGVNEKELLEIIECAKQNNVFFMEGMWTRFFPISQKLIEIVKNNELGEIRHIEANFGFGSWNDINIKNAEHRLFSPALAGGAILDVGIYPIAFTTWLKGKAPENIQTFAKITPLGVDGNTTAIFSYDDNCLAMLQCSVCQQTSSYGRIYFDNGSIELDRFYKPYCMKITHNDGTSENTIDDYQKLGYHGFIYEIEHVIECLNKGLKMSPYYTWEDSLEIVRIMDIMRKQIGLIYPFE